MLFLRSLDFEVTEVLVLEFLSVGKIDDTFRSSRLSDCPILMRNDRNRVISRIKIRELIVSLLVCYSKDLFIVIFFVPYLLHMFCIMEHLQFLD